MAISLKSLKRGGEVKPPISMIHAVHGIGKTSLAAGMPNAVFMQTEDGLGMLDLPTFGLLRDFDSVIGAIGALYNEEHKFQTVVLDSLDHLEPLIWAETCRMNQWKDIEQPGYGKGYSAALDVWRNLLDGFAALRDEKGMAIAMIAHTAPVRFDSPEVESFDRYQPKLQKSASALVQERADNVFFMNYRVSIVKDDKKDPSSRARGSGSGQRVLYTTERPAHLAKNRFRMPDAITLPDDPNAMWPVVAQHMPYYNPSLVTKKD